MTRRTVVDVKVVDTEKRRLPSKHYVYKISVTWSEGSTLVIYRRYSKFFELQSRLLELFPEEGGTKDPTQRMIPFLPGKKIFGRSHVREVAMKRLNPIDEYCRSLVRLPPKVSECDVVMEFFNVWPEDNDPHAEEEYLKAKKSNDQVGESITDPILLEQYTAIADYKKQQKNEVNVKGGELVEVVEKNENGWWFVRVDYEQGWVPASYLEKADGTEEPEGKRLKPGKEEPHITTNSYKAENDDELTFDQGVVVDVVQKNLDGWWLVRYQGREGWVPSAFLTKMKVLPEETSGAAVEIVGSALDAVKSTDDEKQKLQLPQGSISPDTDRKKDGKKRKAAPPKPSAGPVVHGNAGLIAASFGALPGAAKPTPRRNSIKVTRPKKPGGLATAMNRISEVDSAKQSEDSPQYFVAIAAYDGQNPSDLSFEAGSKAEVTQQDPNGWWFVQIGDKEGWVPSTYFEPARSPPIQPKRENTEEQMKQKVKAKAPAPPKKAPKAKKKRKVTQYVTIAAFVSQAGDGISFEGNQVVEVEEKEASGWWYVRIGGKEGWAPSSYIETKEVEIEEEVNEPPVKPSQRRISTGNDLSVVQPASYVSSDKSSNKNSSKDVNPVAAAIAARAQKDQTAINQSSSSEPTKSSIAPRRTTTTASSNISSQGENKTGDSNPLAAALAARASRLEANEKTTDEKLSVPAVKRPVPPRIPKLPKAHHTSASSLSVSPPTEMQKEAKHQPLPKPRRSTDASSLASRTTTNVDTDGQCKERQVPSVLKPRKMTTVGKSDDNRGNSQSNVIAAIAARQQKVESESQSSQVATPKSAKAPLVTPSKGVPKKAPNKQQMFTTISDYNSDDGRFKFKMGEQAVVLEKHENGWWYVEVAGSKGWAPSTYLEQKKQTGSSPGKKSPPARPANSPALNRKLAQPNRPARKTSGDKQNECVATASYTADDQDGISLNIGDNVTVMDRNPNGWWFVRVGQKEGWAPSTYLEEKKTMPPKLGIAKQQDNHNKSNGDISPTHVSTRKTDGPKPFRLPGLPNKSGVKTQNGQPGPPGPPKRPKASPSKQNETTQSDAAKERYKTVADFTADDQEGISFSAGEIAEALEKNENGWWYIKIGRNEGWAPSTYLNKVEQTSSTQKKLSKSVAASTGYQTVAAYSDEGISFNRGEMVRVLEKAENGWWFVEIGGREGWAPSTYITEL